jgi:TRAP-type C4-dicarboxylate transport system permease small subunit
MTAARVFISFSTRVSVSTGSKISPSLNLDLSFYYGLCFFNLVLTTLFFGVGDHIFQFLSREIELFDALLKGKGFVVSVSVHIRFSQIEV